MALSLAGLRARRETRRARKGSRHQKPPRWVPGPGPHLVRSAFQMVGSATHALTFGGAFIAIGFGVALPDSSRWELVVVQVLLIAALMARARRVQTVIDESGVVARNYWWTYKVTWENVTEITAINELLYYTTAVGFEQSQWRGVSCLATIFAGSKAERRQLLEVLGWYALQHQIPFRLGLAPNGSWMRTPAGETSPPPNRRMSQSS